MRKTNCNDYCDSATQYRLVAVLLALDMLKNMLSPALWIMREPESVVSRVGHLATWPDGLAWLWAGLAFAVIPYIVMQVCFHTTTHYRRIVRLACFSVCSSGVLWVYMGYLSRNLGYDVVTTIFIFNGFASVGLGAVLARGLNNQQIADEQKALAACAVKT